MNNTFNQAAEAAYNTLLEIETDAVESDADRRFYASYLLGHLSLIAADERLQAQEVFARVEDSLQQAFAVDRLNDQDKDGIRSLWQAINADIGREL